MTADMPDGLIQTNETISASSREIHKGRMHVMWGGAWVELGEAEFLVEGGRVVKVLSYTPSSFQTADEALEKDSEAPAEEGFLEEQRTGEDG